MGQLSRLDVFSIVWWESSHHTTNTAFDSFGVEIHRTELVENSLTSTGERIVLNLRNVRKLQWGVMKSGVNVGLRQHDFSSGSGVVDKPH